MCGSVLKRLTDGRYHCNICGHVYYESDFYDNIPDSSDGTANNYEVK